MEVPRNRWMRPSTEVTEVANQPVPDVARTKPCLCQVRPLSGLIWLPTGAVNERGEAQFKCRVCGATEWRKR